MNYVRAFRFSAVITIFVVVSVVLLAPMYHAAYSDFEEVPTLLTAIVTISLTATLFLGVKAILEAGNEEPAPAVIKCSRCGHELVQTFEVNPPGGKSYWICTKCNTIEEGKSE